MRGGRLAAILALAGAATPGGAQDRPVPHLLPAPLVATAPPAEVVGYADQGLQIERDRDPRAVLAEGRRLASALATIHPQRRGVVDAYVVSAALDSDPVFAREAREAGRVLERRYGAAGRTLVLAGSDARGGAAMPMGSPQALAAALARVAEQMDVAEDVLVLYLTAHGAPLGIVYNDGDQGWGAISPTRLWTMLTRLGIVNRLVMVSACYSGGFVPMLMSDGTAVVSASAADRSSFGCRADNDWTFFGDALVNRALRRPDGLEMGLTNARRTIGEWEAGAGLTPSLPQVSVGTGARNWLAALERRLPPAGAPVGRPATDALVGE